MATGAVITDAQARQQHKHLLRTSSHISSVNSSKWPCCGSRTVQADTVIQYVNGEAWASDMKTNYGEGCCRSWTDRRNGKWKITGGDEGEVLRGWAPIKAHSVTSLNTAKPPSLAPGCTCLLCQSRGEQTVSFLSFFLLGFPLYTMNTKLNFVYI